jgi:hypothetical protein
MREGIKSSAWEFYMTPFTRDDEGKIDPAKLGRLMGSDGTLGDSIMDRKRGYLIGNAMCGDTTITFLEYGCDSLDDGVGGERCNRFGNPCDGVKRGGRYARGGAKKKSSKKAGKKASKK